MTRTISLLLAAATAALSLTSLTAAAQTSPEVTVKALRGPLHLLQGRGGNVVASVGFDGVLLVDNDYPQYSQAYEDAIAKLAGSDLAPSFVLNTHWHGDHTGNNEFWGMRGAVIVAHRNVRERLSTPQEIPALDMRVEASPRFALPIVTFADSLALHFNGGDIEVQHYPAGHTDGDSVIYYSHDNVVHMGDHYFKDRFPFIDLSSGGSVAGYIDNVEAILARIDDDTLVVPGHGDLADKGDLERYLAMLEATRAAVRQSLQEGMDVQAIVAAGLGEEWAAWGEGFISEEQWIQTLAAPTP